MYEVFRKSTTAEPPISLVGKSHSSIEAIAIAEDAFPGLPLDSVLTVEPAGTLVPIASMTTRRIVGVFHKQVWTGRKQDYAAAVGSVDFDATDAVLRMNFDEVRCLEDHRDSTDEIGLACVEHDGPFEVDVTESICAYFGIDALTDLTEQHFNFVRSRVPPAEQPKITPNTLPSILWINPHAGLEQRSELVDDVEMGRVAGATKKFGDFTQAVFLAPAEPMAPDVQSRATLVDQIARLTIPGETGEDGTVVPEPSDPADAQATLNELIRRARSIQQQDSGETLKSLVDAVIDGLSTSYPRRVFGEASSRAALVAEATAGFEQTGNAQLDYQALCARLESAIDRQQRVDNDEAEEASAPAP